MLLIGIVLLFVYLLILVVANKPAPPEHYEVILNGLRGNDLQVGCIGHRGCRDLVEGVAENTMLAFQTAIERYPSVKAVELDVRMTSDGELVILHDDQVILPAKVVLPTAAFHRREQRCLVSQITFEELKGFLCTTAAQDTIRKNEHSCNGCSSGNGIPRLREVLEYCWYGNSRATSILVMIEIKDPAALTGILALLHTMEAERLHAGRAVCVYAQCWLASFSARVLYTARSLQPSLLTCLLIFGSPLTTVRNALDLQGWHPAEAEAIQAARRRLTKRCYGRLLLSRPLSTVLDCLYNWTFCSRLVSRLLGNSFLAVTPDLATSAAVEQRRRRRIATLVWTVNDLRLRAKFEEDGAFVITDNAM